MNRKTIQHSLLILALASGCSGESQQGLDSQELTRVEDSGADGECRNGGVVVSSGSDANQNGKLDDDEIEGEPIVVCEGESRADPNNPELAREDDRGGIRSHEPADAPDVGRVGRFFSRLVISRTRYSR